MKLSEIKSRLIAEGATEENAERFVRFVSENRHVWEAFKGSAHRYAAEGKIVGAKKIFEDLRYDPAMSTNGREFKLCNTFTPYFARCYCWLFPDRASVFRLRGLGQ